MTRVVAARLVRAALALASVVAAGSVWASAASDHARANALADATDVAGLQAQAISMLMLGIDHTAPVGTPEATRLAQLAEDVERAQAALAEGGRVPTPRPGGGLVLEPPSPAARALLGGPDGVTAGTELLVDAVRGPVVDDPEVRAELGRTAQRTSLQLVALADHLDAERRDAVGTARTALAAVAVMAALAAVVGVALVVRRRSRSRTTLYYRQMLDQMDDQIVRFDTHDLIVGYCNPTWAHRFGVEPDALVGRPVDVVLEPVERQGLMASVARARHGDARATQVAERTDADGNPVIELWGDRLLDGGRQPDFMCVGRDITTLQRAQAELAESERRHRALIEDLPLAAFVLSMDGTVLFANRTAAERLGAVAPDALIGRDWPDLVHPADRPQVVAQAEANTAAPHLELRMTDGRGGWWIADSTGVDISFDGRPAALVAQRDITDQRRAEEMLADAEHRERAILDGLTEAILLHDSTGRITFANHRAAELFGEHESELLLGMHTDTWLTDAVDVDGQPLGRGGLVGHTLETGATSHGREIRVDHDGTARWLRASAIALHDVSAGHPVGVICSLSDITREHRARQALAASEAQHRSVVENLSEGLIVIGPDGRFLSANAAAQRILARDDAEMAISGLFDPSWHVVDEQGDLLAAERMPAAITLATGDSLRDAVIGVRDARDTVRWLSITTQCLDADGARHVVVLFSDITERRRAEAALAASQERFRLLTEHATDLVVARDPQGRFTYVSPSSLELLGETPERLEGTRCQDLVHPDDHGCFAGQTDGQLDVGGDSHRMEMRLRHRDGHHRWFEAIWRPVTDDTGRVVEVHGVARDVQDRKDAAEALAHLATHDALTGLPNRSLLMRRLADTVRGAPPGRSAVLFLDLDRFKPVNDVHGHDAGDELLRAVAERLAARMRASDTVARVGGDEFVVVANDLRDGADAAALAARLEADLREPYALRAATVTIDVSIGIAEIHERVDVDSVLAAADQDMYRVKRSRAATRDQSSGAARVAARPTELAVER